MNNQDDYLNVVNKLHIATINKQLNKNYYNQFKLYFNSWFESDKFTIASWITGNASKNETEEAKDLLSLEISDYDYRDNEDDFPNRVLITIEDYVIEYLKWETIIENYTAEDYKINAVYKITELLKNKINLLGEELTLEIIEKAIKNNYLKKVV